MRGPADLQAVLYVGTGISTVYRLEVITRRHPLGQLAHMLLCQQGTQLGLPDQDDLQQFLRGGFQVGQQTDLLEYFRTQLLRLIDNQHRAAAL